MPGTRFAHLLLIVLQLLAGASPGAWAADPLRGATLFATAPAPGLLGCIDCHSDNPHLNNFGNIWVGRNAEALIRRAVASNTGGMGYFNAWYGADDFADIAAYLGNVPSRLEFPLTAPGRRSAPQPVRVLASTKQGIDALQLAVEGDFVIAGSDCGTSVARFGSCTVDLAFEPMASGLRSGSLWITHAGTPTPIRVALEGAGSERPPAVARVEPARLDFAPLAAGQLGSQRSARLVNDSEQPLGLESVAIEGADFQHVGGSCVAGTTLAPRAACTVALRFAPVTAAPAQGVLRFVHDGVNGASEVALVAQGQAPAPQLRAEPPALDLGWLPPGSQGPWQRIRLHAQGSVAVALDTIEVSAAAFVVDRLSCTAGRVLAAGESCDLAVSLRAGSEALLGGELRIAASGLRIPLSARVASQASPAPGGGAPTEDAMPDLWVDHAELAFAPHRPGAAAHELNLVLWHRGTAPLVWRAALTGAMTSDFAVDGDCAEPLQPQQRCTLRLAFTARATGWREATLVLGTDTAAPPVTVHLRGRGLPAAQAGWAADPPRQDFPAQPPGTAAVRRVWLQNLGTEPLPPPLPRFEGPFRAAPGSPGCEAAVAPGRRCAFDIEFAPLAEGSATGQLLLAAPGVPPLQMPLAGTGRGGTAWFDTPTAATFADAAVGAPAATLALPLTNRGSAASEPMQWSFSGPAAGDFSLDAASGCQPGQVLPAGAACTLRLRFHPTAAGLRQARLALGGAPAAAVWSLQGQAFAPARAVARAWPDAVAFAIAPGIDAATQRLLLRNDGAAELSVVALRVDPAAFGSRSDGETACPAGAFLLQPGDACSVELLWNGSSDGGAGGRWQASVDGAAAGVEVPLSLAEDPTRINQGSGAVPPWPVLGLLLAAWLLRRARSECRNE